MWDVRMETDLGVTRTPAGGSWMAGVGVGSARDPALRNSEGGQRGEEAEESWSVSRQRTKGGTAAGPREEEVSRRSERTRLS